MVVVVVPLIHQPAQAAAEDERLASEWLVPDRDFQPAAELLVLAEVPDGDAGQSGQVENPLV